MHKHPNSKLIINYIQLQGLSTEGVKKDQLIQNL